METVHTFTADDGAQIAYRRRHASSAGALPPLVLMHGAASNMTRWSEFVDASTLSERNIIRLDLRGHGQSLYRGKITLEIWADDLAALLRHEQIPAAVVGGHCLGANIAVMFAARHPDRTAGLVLVEPMLRPALTGRLRRLIALGPALQIAIAAVRGFNRLGVQRRRLVSLDLRELDREFRASLTQPGGGDVLVRRYSSVWHDLKIMPTANFLRDLTEVVRALPLHRIQSPFLALLSTGRTFADPDITREILSALPNGTIQRVDARHWIPTEQPDQMRRAIDEWCKGSAMQGNRVPDFPIG
jgi:pimeloyl-ACP methyl ester carboxylesterase